MKEFTYTAKERGSKKPIKGKIYADNKQAAASLLITKDLYPIKIKPATAAGAFASFQFSNKVKSKDRVIFTRQLATLVKAGLPITQALNTAIGQIEDKKFRSKLEKISTSVEGGQTLAESFGQYPEIFNSVYINLVNAGEESGTLDESLIRLANQQEKDAKISSSIKGAFIYPALVLVAILGVLGFMLVSVLPQVSSLYIDLKKPLPPVTQATLFIANTTIRFWYIALLLIAAIIFGIRAYLRTSTGRNLWDSIKLNVPVFNTLFKKIYMARFARTLGSLSASGVPLLRALTISADSMNNVILKKIVLKAENEVRSGGALSNALNKNKYFIKLVPQMIKVGEESGTLGSMLDKVATLYEDEVDQTVKNISTIIEPVLMIFLGGMIFFIIIAVLYPVYNLVGSGFDPSAGSSSTTTTK